MNITELSAAFLTMANTAIAQLQNELTVGNLLEAWLHRRIPQRGTLTDGSTFQFHGIGCVVERPDDIDIDFDFNESGAVAPVDDWRLWRFAKQFPQSYPDFQHRHQVITALEKTSSRD